MKQKLFISYSRRQTPFVDRLAEELENSGYTLWLDYHNLVPAEPWLQQIESGIAESDSVILIVSKESIESKNVEPEWRRALEQGKRIILVIFEAVRLPAELQACEWVDFRVNYKHSLLELKTILDKPTGGVASTPPQSGFKAPITFWLMLSLSGLVMIGSIPAWWTMIVPYLLIPLPWQVHKRNYFFSRLVPILLILPLFTTFSAIFFAEGGILNGLSFFYNASLYPTFFISWCLVGLLFTPVLQRRALPQAARVRFANPLMVNVQIPHSVTFAIDHAPEDGRYAEDLRRGLESHGHRQVTEGEKPEAAFVLLSTYKTKTEYDADHQAVYPVLLQPVDHIDLTLQRIQWIDFRNGIHNIHKLAKLLPEPKQLLKALAVAPTTSQEVYPLAVNALQYFYLFTGIMGGGGLFISMFSVGSLIGKGLIAQDQWINFFLAVLNGLLLFGAIFYSVRGLRSRRGGTAAIYPLLVLTFFQLMIYFSNIAVLATSALTNNTLFDLMSRALVGETLTLWALPLALLITLPILLFRWKELYRWLPRRQNAAVGRLESLLLLYNPLDRRAFIFHIIFHVLLFIIYGLLILLSVPLLGWLPVKYALPLLVLAFGIRWQARRMST